MPVVAACVCVVGGGGLKPPQGGMELESKGWGPGGVSKHRTEQRRRDQTEGETGKSCRESGMTRVGKYELEAQTPPSARHEVNGQAGRERGTHVQREGPHLVAQGPCKVLEELVL